MHLLHRLPWICSNSWQNSDSDNDHAFTYGARTLALLNQSFEDGVQRIPIIGITVYMCIYSTIQGLYRLGEMLPGDEKKKRYAMHVMNEVMVLIRKNGTRGADVAEWFDGCL